MVTLTDVLEINWIILYFVYGQVFFIMGLMTGLQWRYQSRLELARALPWLAAFGIAHGLTEWGYIFVPLQALYLSDSAVRLMLVAHLSLLAISFYFILQFGIELLLPLWPRHRWLRALPGALLLLWGGVTILRGMRMDDPLNVLIAIGDSWSRYLLCLPGSILAFLGLGRQARQVRQMDLPRIAVYLNGAALAFLVYAFVGGLIVPTAPVFPANFLNYSFVNEIIRVPVPVFRSLCGLAMAVFVVRSLKVFKVEVDYRITEMEQAQILATDRERIGRELHDGIIQNIYAAGLTLERMQRRMTQDPDRAHKLQAVLNILNQTAQDVRNYIFDLRVAEQTHELETVLEDLVRDLRLDTLLEVNLHVVGQRSRRIGPQQVAHLTQIAREALSNVVQHAQARYVSVNLNYADDGVRLKIADDGQGIALETLQDDHISGYGIANIQERIRQMEGEFSLESSHGHGFQLFVTIPYTDDQDQS
ncbi:MAG: hypothetical protein GY832_20585 [Chloroflexi bacterium]|nr:hypothetical protein [Chloroflexota bacterium]